MALPMLMLSVCLLGAVANSEPFGSGPIYYPEYFDHYFEYFMDIYKKTYANEQEKEERFQIFKDNLLKANALNKEHKGVEFGMTQFSDLTPEEFDNRYTCLGGLEELNANLTSLGCTDISDAEIPDANAPESHDWRQHNVLGRIKNQGSCGGCYAFSAAGNIASHYAIKTKQLLELSEQQLIDCDSNSHGCQGGYMTTAFRTVIQEGGIETESSYPYAGIQQPCNFVPGKAAVRVTGCYSYNLRSQEKVKQVLFSSGPISIGVRASNFQQYHQGVMPDSLCAGGAVNHAVLLVGYGIENGQKYWIGKNSWGEIFGEGGYFRMQRGESAGSCGMMYNGFMSSSVVM